MARQFQIYWKVYRAKSLKHLMLIVIAFHLGPTSANAVTVKQVTSPGGIVAWLVEDHSIPITSIEFSFRGGAAIDRDNKQGLANLVAGLLDEGAAELDSQAFQRRLYERSVTLTFSTGLDTFRGSLKTLNRHRNEAINLLRLALTQPRFDLEPVKRIRRQVISTIRRRSNDPNYIAARTLWRTIFPDHPYGRSLNGTEKSVSDITIDDMRTFITDRFAKNMLIVGVVGDISEFELAKLLDHAFGGLPDVAKTSLLKKANPSTVGKTYVVKQKVPQSVIQFGQPGLVREDVDYYVGYVMNHILGGGGFSSRLYEEVREKRGLAYSVYSYNYPLAAGALIIGGAATVNERAGESLDVIRAEWKRMRDYGPSQYELDIAKRYLTGSWALSFDNMSQMARMLVGMQYNKLGIDYLDRRNGYIDSINKADIDRVASRVLDPKKLTVIVVGMPKGIGATSELLDIKN